MIDQTTTDLANDTSIEDLEALLAWLESHAPSSRNVGTSTLVDAETSAKIELLHDEVRDASERCDRVCATAATRRRLHDALDAERIALEEFGFDSYSAFASTVSMDTELPNATGTAHNPTAASQELDPTLGQSISELLARPCATYAEAIAAVRSALDAPSGEDTSSFAPGSSIEQEADAEVDQESSTVVEDEADEPNVGAVNAEYEELLSLRDAARVELDVLRGELDGANNELETIRGRLEATATEMDPADATGIALDALVMEPGDSPLSALFAPLYRSVQLVAGGLAATQTESEAAITALLDQRHQAAAELDTVLAELAQVRQAGDAERQRAACEAAETRAAAQEEATQMREQTAQRIRETETRLLALSAEAASLASDLAS